MARQREFNAQGWREVSKEVPCKACGRSHGCRESRDGNFICWRVPSSRPRGAGWWHPGEGWGDHLPSLAPPMVARAEAIADDFLLHQVYQDLLELCPLASAHRKHLSNEGWTAEEIGQFRCGSLPVVRSVRRAIVKELWEKYGHLLSQVPGFIVKEGARGNCWAEVCSSGGLLLPCVSLDGRIRRLRLRPDEPKPNGPKYVWLSSSRHGGPGSGSPPAF